MLDVFNYDPAKSRKPPLKIDSLQASKSFNSSNENQELVYIMWYDPIQTKVK